MTRSVNNDSSIYSVRRARHFVPLAAPRVDPLGVRRFVPLGVLAVSLLVTLSLATSALAQAQVQNYQGPGGQTVRASGLDLQFDNNWVEGPGYIPVRITAGQFGPARSERSLVIELTHSVRGGRKSVVRQRIDVPVPPQKATVCVPVPKWTIDYNNNYELTVYEDGRKLKKLSGTYVSLPTTAVNGTFNEALPQVLVIAPSPPDSSTLGNMLPRQYGYQGQYGYGATPNPVVTRDPLRSLVTVTPADLPTEWIDYTCVDVVVISRKQLASLATAQPEAWTAIRRWVLAGGNIVVHGLESDWSGLEEIDDVLAGVPATAQPDGAGPSNDTGQPDDAGANGWETSTDRKLSRRLRAEVSPEDYNAQMTQQGRPGYGPGYVTQPSDADGDDGNRRAKKPDAAERRARENVVRQQVRSRPAGVGYVVAIAEEELFPGDDVTWRVVLNTIGDTRWHWHQRHGVSMVQENRHFWEFLIPGVGHALVTEFQILISLFVVLIGPVNYFLLRRRHKLHLIVFTTPASAAILTIALMAWGLVADGIATRTRARSYTYIDQRDGTAVCWSRLSYYAGIAPSGGLVFPRDVAVLPIRVEDASASSVISTTRWDDSQRLESGWLASRTPTQFMTIRSRTTAARLGIETKTGSDDGDSPKMVVTNRLGTRVDQLVVCDADGNHYAITTPMQPNDVRTLSRLGAKGLNAARTNLKLTLDEHRPRKPDGVIGDMATGYSPQYGRFNSSYQGDRVTAGSNRLERGYAAVNKHLTAPTLKLAPATYLAIVERSPEVTYGTPQAQEEASTHLVQGAW